MADLYIDENFPLPATEELRRLGHDVVTLQKSGHGGMALPDDEVLRVATRERRAVVTLNRRHFVRLHEQGASHAGIVVCSADGDFIRLATRIDAVIREYGQLSGQLVRVNRSS